ncbi:NADP-dependent oxidoreductase [Frondihabitans australicus]|uniref:NADPH:quinone reductase-like Zn-dependent oxidoreductase n=1 Tax=Frondihabitans australicus TaxID=386892 RepID=A0A495IC99_9MICO|nr:NADP-dependent oxidoreductase [Frondihabitans australicus]RKR73098.1 NADPH:quinone reductase-like Zn-dependent oxidoreductase [Frondihabitans australicus]
MKTTTERPTLTATMRAMVITENGEPDVLTEATIATPSRLGSEVLVRVIAAGVNPLDADARAGRVGSCGTPELPAVLGCDFSGVVVESPYAACTLKPGVEVYGVASVPRAAGTYAEYVSVPLLSVARKPASLSHVEAAAVPLAALTAWGIVVDVAKAHEGQRILVHAAAGGVGHFVVQFAAYFGAHVIATASTRNASWLRQLGAAQVVDYTAGLFEDEVPVVDVVIDLVDDDDVALRSIEVLRLGGTMIHVPPREVPGLQDRANGAGARLTGYETAPDATCLAIIARLIDSGDVTVYVDDVYDLEDVADAHRRLAQHHTRGKLVLRVADE